jgi:hypothetical protein
LRLARGPVQARCRALGRGLDQVLGGEDHCIACWSNRRTCQLGTSDPRQIGGRMISAPRPVRPAGCRVPVASEAARRNDQRGHAA